jgi:hypothetical protein
MGPQLAVQLKATHEEAEIKWISKYECREEDRATHSRIEGRGPVWGS